MGWLVLTKWLEGQYKMFSISGGYTLAFVIIGALGFACTAGYLAHVRGYNPNTWFLLGLIFGGFALVAIAFPPVRQPNFGAPDSDAPKIG